jgi:hypothetical protein
MNSRFNPCVSEVSASQPISSPAVCSDCGVVARATCPACDDSACLAHLYSCADCDASLCSSCLAAHRDQGHWTDSDTAAELRSAQALRSFHGAAELRHANAHHPSHPATLPEPDRARSGYPIIHSDGAHTQPSQAPPVAHDDRPQWDASATQPSPLAAFSNYANAPEMHSQRPGSRSPSSSLDTNTSSLLQRLLAHVQAHSKSRRLHPRALHACFYIQIFCVRCGYMRQALPALPHDETAPCPGCARQRPYVSLAIGFTTRALPFYERFFLAGHASHQLPWDKLRTTDRRRTRPRKPPSHSLDSESRELLRLHVERFRHIAESMLRST